MAQAPDMQFEAYDGAKAGPLKPVSRVTFLSPAAFLCIARAPRGLGMARALAHGHVRVQGSWNYMAANESGLAHPTVLIELARALPAILRAARVTDFKHSGSTIEEYKPARWNRNSTIERSRAAQHHYDLPTQFYSLVLGTTLNYSCAIFRSAEMTLDEAQEEKMKTICRKLDLTSRDVLLDIGCGWGSLVAHATLRWGCHALGVTPCVEQYEFALSRDLPRAELLRQEFREVPVFGRVTAVSSVGVYEHVGRALSHEFFTSVRNQLSVGGRYLNQTIIRATGSRREKVRRRTFVDRYVFPYGDIQTIEPQLEGLAIAGFKVEHVEFFGEDYARTISAWQQNIHMHYQECVNLIGPGRLQVWLAYLAGARQRFLDGEIELVQVLSSVAK